MGDNHVDRLGYCLSRFEELLVEMYPLQVNAQAPGDKEKLERMQRERKSLDEEIRLLTKWYVQTFGR